MLIDWFTVAAQVVNFLILVWLLKHFLYQPILDAIDAREERIAAKLADAAAQLAEASREREEFQRKNADFETQRTALLDQAADEAKQERRRLVKEAEDEAGDLLNRRMERLGNDARDLDQAISRKAQGEVFAIARKVLADLANTSLEQCASEEFRRRLLTLDEADRKAFSDAMNGAAEPVLLRSAFELSADQHTALQAAVQEAFAGDVEVRFETSPDIVSGIELSTDGRKIAWSIADYLSSLEEGVAQLIKQQLKPSGDDAASPVVPESDAKVH